MKAFCDTSIGKAKTPPGNRIKVHSSRHPRLGREEMGSEETR